ncbi:MAG TPA: HAD-IA family hydrolase [Acidimicrobiia bacterium]|nr:HAD-IA family hydrolase [Acidimicrobiia bacterium]
MLDVDAVLLDLGGVFYLPDHARIVSALRQLGVTIDPDDLDQAHYEGVAALRAPAGPDNPRLDHHGDGSSVWHAYNRAYASVCGVPDDALDEATRILLAEFGLGDVWTRVIPGAREALVDLAELDVVLAVVSNADGTVERQLRDDGICQVGPGAGVEVGIVLDSGVVGVSKPDPRIFELALEALQVAPERTIHVGDTPAADVEGALAAGVQPVLIDPYDLHPDAPCARARSLGEVAARLRGASRVVPPS